VDKRAPLESMVTGESYKQLSNKNSSKKEASSEGFISYRIEQHHTEPRSLKQSIKFWQRSHQSGISQICPEGSKMATAFICNSSNQRERSVCPRRI